MTDIQAPENLITREDFLSVCQCIKLETPLPKRSNELSSFSGDYLAMPSYKFHDLVKQAGLSMDDFLQSGCYPMFRIAGADIELQRRLAVGIYSIEKPGDFGNRYFLELLPEPRRLVLRYQQILGSRILYGFSDEDLQALEANLVAQLKAFKETEAFVAMTARAVAVRESIAKREARETLERSKAASALMALPLRKPAEQLSPIPSTSATVLSELALLTPRDNVLLLPTVHLMHYAKLRAMLLTAGAKYDGGLPGFRFKPNVVAKDVLSSLLAGETVNPKKDFQFFASTAPVVEAIRGQLPESLHGKSMLEPSAGDGVLADLGKELGANVTTVELWEQNVVELTNKGYAPVAEDFLKLTPADLGLFDVIVANPPFTKGQDIKHLLHMTRFLKPDGRLLCVTSLAWKTSKVKAAVAFQEFLTGAQAEFIELPAGTFNESGTSVGAVLVCLQAQNIPQTALPLAA